MEPAVCRVQLSRLLERELACATHLGQALHAECEALTTAAAAALEEAVKEKERQVGALEGLARQRERLLQAAGYTADRPGMEQCLAWCDPARTLSERWRELLALIEQCRAQNLVNGGLVEQSRHRTERALAILRGQAAETPLYGATGKTASNPSSRPLGRV